MRFLFAALALGLAIPTGAAAQDFEVEEEEIDFNEANIVVTGTRIRSDFEGYSDSVPLVGYQRQADFLLQPIRITGDTRDAGQRVREVYQTIERFLRAANAQGIALAYGDVVTTDVTSANVRDLPLRGAGRPDTSGITLYATTKLSEMNVATAQERLSALMNDFNPVGRALVESGGSPSLSIVGPDRYRPQIVEAVAADANAMAARFGDGYAVEVTGLEGTVQWQRRGTTDLFLYIPYRLTITPKP
ncbi:TonB-dependent receptor [Sphingomicrobium flavum]|uniref:TonB-dependent receptor n=1 Tax=Sphingomicrobium flavum TaxID=1229164 RepID=UPI0021ADFBD0|nr:TonB-dependent receptor [Sphingomicrobium flavum]